MSILSIIVIIVMIVIIVIIIIIVMIVIANLINALFEFINRCQYKAMAHVVLCIFVRIIVI